MVQHLADCSGPTRNNDSLPYPNTGQIGLLSCAGALNGDFERELRITRPCGSILEEEGEVLMVIPGETMYLSLSIQR